MFFPDFQIAAADFERIHNLKRDEMHMVHGKYFKLKQIFGKCIVFLFKYVRTADSLLKQWYWYAGLDLCFILHAFTFLNRLLLTSKCGHDACCTS